MATRNQGARGGATVTTIWFDPQKATTDNPRFERAFGGNVPVEAIADRLKHHSELSIDNMIYGIRQWQKGISERWPNGKWPTGKAAKYSAKREQIRQTGHHCPSAEAIKGYTLDQNGRPCIFSSKHGLTLTSTPGWELAQIIKKDSRAIARFNDRVRLKTYLTKKKQLDTMSTDALQLCRSDRTLDEDGNIVPCDPDFPHFGDFCHSDQAVRIVLNSPGNEDDDSSSGDEDDDSSSEDQDRKPAAIPSNVDPYGVVMERGYAPHPSFPLRQHQSGPGVPFSIGGSGFAQEEAGLYQGPGNGQGGHYEYGHMGQSLGAPSVGPDVMKLLTERDDRDDDWIRERNEKSDGRFDALLGCFQKLSDAHLKTNGNDHQQATALYARSRQRYSIAGASELPPLMDQSLQGTPHGQRRGADERSHGLLGHQTEPRPRRGLSQSTAKAPFAPEEPGGQQGLQVRFTTPTLRVSQAVRPKTTGGHKHASTPHLRGAKSFSFSAKANLAQDMGMTSEDDLSSRDDDSPLAQKTLSFRNATVSFAEEPKPVRSEKVTRKGTPARKPATNFATAQDASEWDDASESDDEYSSKKRAGSPSFGTGMSLGTKKVDRKRTPVLQPKPAAVRFATTGDRKGQPKPGALKPGKYGTAAKKPSVLVRAMDAVRTSLSPTSGHGKKKAAQKTHAGKDERGNVLMQDCKGVVRPQWFPRYKTKPHNFCTRGCSYDMDTHKFYSCRYNEFAHEQVAKAKGYKPSETGSEMV